MLLIHVLVLAICAISASQETAAALKGVSLCQLVQLAGTPFVQWLPSHMTAQLCCVDVRN